MDRETFPKWLDDFKEKIPEILDTVPDKTPATPSDEGAIESLLSLRGEVPVLEDDVEEDRREVAIAKLLQVPG